MQISIGTQWLMLPLLIVLLKMLSAFSSSPAKMQIEHLFLVNDANPKLN